MITGCPNCGSTRIIEHLTADQPKHMEYHHCMDCSHITKVETLAPGCKSPSSSTQRSFTDHEFLTYLDVAAEILGVLQNQLSLRMDDQPINQVRRGSVDLGIEEILQARALMIKARRHVIVGLGVKP